MGDEKHPNMEDQLLTRNERVLDLYDAKSSDLPDEEEESLLPILNSLEESEERYKEIDLIAEGGEKRVTRVHDHRLNRQIAMARAIKAKNRQDQEQFLREAQLEANLAHPNIVPVHNMGIDPEGVPFFTMELIPGDSLKTVIKELREGNEEYVRRYPLSVLLHLFLKICDAIAYAHSRNVLHLDIKPDNIRVGEFGEVFICDWGLARILYSDMTTTDTGTLDGDILNDMTQTGMLKGTPGFMAPEQTRSQGDKIFQTDIYAMGALLYNILTYELPVSGNSANELIENTKAGKIIPPHSRRKGAKIPRGLATVSIKAMALDPSDRYPSVVELRAEITRYLNGLPTQAERAGIGTRLSLLIKRHNQYAALLIFSLLLLAAVISVNMVKLNRQKAAAVSARVQAEKNFRLYREQQDEVAKLGIELSDTTHFTAQSGDYSKAREMIRALEIALDKNPEPQKRNDLLVKKGTAHFVLQEFNAASECFEESKPSKPIDLDSWQLSKKYATLKPNDRRMLSLQQATELVEETMSLNKAINYFYYYYIMRKPSPTPEAYLPLAMAMLDKVNRINPTTSKHPMKLEKRPNGHHLDLTGSSYQIFSLSGIGLLRINILEPLEPYSMDISNLPLLTLAEFKGLHVKELNMTGVKTSRRRILIKQLEEMGVQRVIMTTGDYPDDIVDELRSKIEIIDSESSSR
ncbi:serine/threonine protein kinase [Pontiella sulfatireligans]|uniref:Serine/threonine-protein kinase PknD n=1 Tax=Pontiella sulfatireligans TaxID=2750658 RepID=A0A6C2UGH8_9BACT|nr:serine/threonine-protein kinase [Pontiella sulfatireligans]VGO19238.1 Serine/threonine-protein kinase PknD [Pontiella sulfatireligans]